MCTQYSPFITPGNEAYVHHILIYECGGLTNASVGESGVCGDEVSNTVSECRSGTLVAGWAVGGTVYLHAICLILSYSVYVSAFIGICVS